MEKEDVISCSPELQTDISSLPAVAPSPQTQSVYTWTHSLAPKPVPSFFVSYLRKCYHHSPPSHLNQKPGMPPLCLSTHLHIPRLLTAGTFLWIPSYLAICASLVKHLKISPLGGWTLLPMPQGLVTQQPVRPGRTRVHANLSLQNWPPWSPATLKLTVYCHRVSACFWHVFTLPPA